MQAEKKVRSYTRRTKSGKTVTVKAHTAKYEAADKKDAAKKKGAGKELEDKKKTSIVGKPELETPFTKDEFKEWYEGTGSAADKKVAKALRKQLGRSGYRKFEDEAIDNYTSRGHLSMFKKLGSMGGDKRKPVRAKNDTFYPKYTDRGDTKKNLAEEKRQWANHYNETKSESARKGYIQALNRYKGIGGGKLTATEKAMLADGASSKKPTVSKTTEKTDSAKSVLKGNSKLHRWFKESPKAFSKVSVQKSRMSGNYHIHLADGSGQVYDSKEAANKDAKLLRSMYKEWSAKRPKPKGPPARESVSINVGTKEALRRLKAYSSKRKSQGTPYELASATLKKSGLVLHQLKNTPTAMEVYKAGDRKSLKNLIAGITYNGRHISFGGRFEKENKKKYSSVIAKALKEAGYGVEQ